MAAASAPRPTISKATTGLVSQVRTPATAMAPAAEENISLCKLPTTSALHSQSTATAATIQNSAKGQSPTQAVSRASGPNTRAERTRKARLLPDSRLLSEFETGFTSTTRFRIRFVRRDRQTAARVAGIRGLRI